MAPVVVVWPVCVVSRHATSNPTAKMALIVRMKKGVATNASHHGDSIRHPIMQAKNIAYWVTTGIIVSLMLSGGIMQIARSHDAVEGIARLGYPVYFVVLLGVWKVLGSAALLAPKMPLLKEWAYAGFFFDLTGAAVSHAAMGSSTGNVIGPIVFAGLATASWSLRPDSRRLRGADARILDVDGSRRALAHDDRVGTSA